MNRLLAATFNIGNFNGIGELGNTNVAFQDQFAKVISLALGVLTVCAGLWFVVQIFSGAISWLSSGGDKQGIQNAQKRISHAIIGLFMVVAAYGLIATIGLIFGLDILGIENQLLNLHP